MTVTYKARGKLDHPVSDLNEARVFLREHGQNMHEYIYPDEAKPGVHSVTWDLLDEESWEVTLIADYELEQQQINDLSDWILGQNSDGLGESFEQQPFAEHEQYNDEDEEPEYAMSSFDWQINPCTLEQIK